MTDVLGIFSSEYIPSTSTSLVNFYHHLESHVLPNHLQNLMYCLLSRRHRQAISEQRNQRHLGLEDVSSPVDSCNIAASAVHVEEAPLSACEGITEAYGTPDFVLHALSDLSANSVRISSLFYILSTYIEVIFIIISRPFFWR